MKIICERDKLLNAFATASTVAPSRSPKPILQNVKLEAAPEQTSLLATDLETAIRLEVLGVDVAVPGAVVLPTQRFGAILRESGDAKLSIETDGQGTLVRGERSRYKLSAANPDEFPPVAMFQETRYHEVPARLFREMIRRTVFATDNESTRYALGGVLLELSDEQIVAVGTDGRRLATMQGPARAVANPEVAGVMTIVPTKAVHLIERALAEATTEVWLAPKANSLLVRCERTTIYTRLVEGRFPKWRDVFPQRTNSTKIELAVSPTNAAVRQASVFTNDESRGIEFRFGNGALTLQGETAEVGESLVELPISYDGPELSIVLDPRYVMDFLKVVDADRNFTFDVQDGESAAVCTTDDGYSYVIMPLARDP